MALAPGELQRRILDGVERLLDVDDFEGLQSTMTAVVADLVACDHVAYNELDPDLDRMVARYNDPEVEALGATTLPAFTRLFHQHPIVRHVNAHPGAPPQRLSDFLSRPRLHDLAFYQEVFKPLRTEYQAVIPLFAPGRATLGLALNREARDFTDAERLALARLQPFLQRVYGEVRRRHLVRLLLDGRAEPILVEALTGLGLTEREAEACFLMTQGKSNREIGEILGISRLTAKTHCEKLFAKLGAGGRVDVTKRVIGALLQMTEDRGQRTENR